MAVAASCLHAADEPSLLKTDLFSIGAMGPGGGVSPSEMEFRELLKQENSEKALLSLIDNGSPEAKLYGLLGLKMLESQKYQEAYDALKGSREKARSGSGCIVFTLESAVIIDQINKDAYK